MTLGAGFKGGEDVVPSFAVGASFGCVVAPLLGLDASLGAALGMVAVFCGVSNCPFASIFLGVELCGSRYVVLFAIVCAVSLLFSGNCSLYSSQRILNDKFDLAIIPTVKKKESADDSREVLKVIPTIYAELVNNVPMKTGSQKETSPRLESQSGVVF